MRAYFFGNLYLSSIQQGIQSTHVVSDMFVKYKTISEDSDPKQIMLWEWAQNHKTVILLNGGFSKTLHEMIGFFDDEENPYPWTEFHEGKEALDGVLTDVGIILPQKIYKTCDYIRHASYEDRNIYLDEINNQGTLVVPIDKANGEIATWRFTKWEYQLIQKLNTFSLAS